MTATRNALVHSCLVVWALGLAVARLWSANSSLACQSLMLIFYPLFMVLALLNGLACIRQLVERAFQQVQMQRRQETRISDFEVADYPIKC